MNATPPRDTPYELDFLSVSIVVYKPDEALLSRTIDTLRCALSQVHGGATRTKLYLVDNGAPERRPKLPSAANNSQFDAVMLGGHGNVGYGQGHNLAVERARSCFHLILNPDIELDTDALRNALAFLRASPETGLLTPWIGDEDGHQQFLCRRFPTVFDLFARGFLPSRLRPPFKNRLARYEMRDVIDGEHVVWDPPIVSGCFMLFRTDVLKKLGGFDPRYFLYFEDYDLSLRTHEIARVAYVPSVRVLHHGGDAARKGGTHIKLFITSAFKFFNRFGWKWL